MDWSKGHDIQLRRTLNHLSNDLDRLRRLKKGGVNALPADVARRVQELLTRLQQVGLFLVPVGQLEEWLAAENLGVSKENKWAWANAAAKRIHERGRQEGDVWTFVATVGRYLVR